MSDKKINNNLREVRRQLNMSSSQVAEQLGVSVNTVYDMEQRALDSYPIFSYLHHLQATGASLDDMLLEDIKKISPKS